MLKDKRIFISGGAGVIGHCLVKRLTEAGAIILVGDLKPLPSDFPAGITYRRGDLNFMTFEELSAFAPEIMFHLAATFERSEETPEFWDENYHHNVQLSHHLADLCRQCASLKKVVFASSYLNYDPDLYLSEQPSEKAVALSEHSPVRPRNLCGAAKFYHEAELEFLSSVAGVSFETISARIFRSYGKGSRDIVSRWVTSLLAGEEISVFAEDGVFDYIFADDVAQGLISLAAPGNTGIVNLGRGEGRRVKELIEVLRDNFPHLKSINKKSFIPYEASMADMEHFEKITGWRPKTRLEEAVPQIIDYQKHSPVLENPAPFKVLITSISRKTPMIREVRRALEKFCVNGVIYGADCDQNCLGRHFVDHFWHMPPLRELNVKDIISYCHKHGISAIIPSRDGELDFFARLKPELTARGISVMISPPEAVKTCLDKLEFYQALLHEDVCPPVTTTLNPDQLRTNTLVVKERFGAGSASLGLGLAPKAAQRHAEKLDSPVFQPMVKGVEYSIDIYITMAGEVKGTIARVREQVVNGESMVTASRRHRHLEEACGNIARSLGLRGHVIFQVIEDDKGGLHLIECNCRFGGASTLSVAAGLDSFYWFLTEASGGDCAAMPFIRSPKELRQIRHPADIIEVCDDRGL